MTKPIDGIVGIDFTSAGGRNDDFSLNVEVQTSTGIWCRAVAAEAIAVSDVVKIAASGTASLITAANAITSGKVGVARTAVSTGSSFWAQRTGNFAGVNVLNGCLPAVPLYTTDTAGKLDDATASASHHQVQSLILNSTNNGTTASSIPAAAGGFLTIRRPPA